jgi:hypothetical protein
MKTSLRQSLLIAVGIFAGILASFNLFAQAPTKLIANQQYAIDSQAEYEHVVQSIQSLAGKLYDAHVKYPQLSYTHVYNNNGALMGFTVTGVSHSAEANEISASLMKLELLGNAISTMDQSYLPKDDGKLTSRISKKKAMQSQPQEPVSETLVFSAATNPDDLLAANK